MADDAEQAFLQAQQEEYDPAAGYGHYSSNDVSADQEEYDPAATYSPHESHHSASMAPESAAQTPLVADAADQNGANAASTYADGSITSASSKRPRTVGGFVDESEDEEDEPTVQSDAAAAALLNASVAAETPQRSFTNTPNNTLANQDPHFHSAQDQGAASLSTSVAANEPAPSLASSLPNRSTPVPDATKQGGSGVLNVAAARQSAAPPTPVPMPSALPKARLPQDHIGILEDRIAEDPRGDIEAWQSLISEYRRRHKDEDVRATYERFLKVFPAAVSHRETHLFGTRLTCTG